MGKVLHLLTGSEFEVEVRLDVEQWREGPDLGLDASESQLL